MKVFHFRPYTLHLGRYELSRISMVLPLPRIAMEILILLVEQRGDLVTRQEIAAKVWPGSDPEDVFQSINTAINRIRSTLRDEAASPKYIQTVIGMGYRFIAPVEVEEYAPVTPSWEDTEAVATGGAPPRDQAPIQKTSADEPISILRRDRGEQLLDQTNMPAATPTRPAAAVADPVSASGRASAGSPPWLRRWAPWTVFALLVAWSAAFAIFRLRLSRTPAAFTLAAPVRWTANGSDNPVGTAAISPDGQTLAFTDADGLLIQRRRDVAPTLQPALDLSEIDHLSWFPDGKHIAVSGVAKTGAASQVWIIAADGTSKPSLLRNGIRGATVSPITGNIAYLNNDGAEVWEANSDGSGARLLRSADAGTVFDRILWTFGKPTLLVEQVRLPSRKELEANPNAVPSPQESTLMALNRQNGAVTASAHGFRFTEGCSLPGARLMLEGLDEHHHSIPVSATFNPDLPGLFETPPELYSPPNAAVPMSCSVAAITGDTALLLRKGESAVYVGELAKNDLELLRPHPLTSGEYGAYPHAWTPDSQSVLYEQRHGEWFLFQQQVDRHDPQPLIQPQIKGVGARVSPDGRWILFFSKDTSGSFRLFHVPVGGSNGEAMQLPVPAGDLRCPRVGTECIFRVKDAVKHTVELYALQPANGATRFLRALPWEEASFTDWDVSPDGTSVVLCGSVTTIGVLHIVNLRDQQERTETFPVAGSFRAINWNSSGRGWFGITYTRSGANLYFLGPSQNATLLRRTTAFGTWGVPSPDGRKLAFVDLNQDRNVWLTQESVARSNR